ncbi:MAG: UDP-N-acetylmuramate dehydrogenase [Planctomycetota bacterium]|jgi:UDP-N-acetylmuramate dehydrogenase
MATGVSSLFGDLEVEVTPDAPVGASTWYGVGGHADLLVRPRSLESLATLCKRCSRTGTPLRVLGAGANLLVADGGVGGVVVRLDASVFQEIKYNPDGDIHALRAMAGADLARTLMETTRQGLQGLDHMAGIPASIGGAIRMNAGGRFGAISDNLRSVTCVTKNGDLVTYPISELRFDYRRTNIPDPIIVSAVFALTAGDPVALRERVKEIFQYKKASQPLAEHSAGCAFRNPIDPVLEQRVSAGRLIEEAGLKGEHVGGASISRQHANFIVTEPGATASDVLELMELVRQRVFDHCGLELEREVVVWER